MSKHIEAICRVDEGMKSKGAGAVYHAVASTIAMDRDKEVLIPKGVLIDFFMKNPVMLNIHQLRQVPVGKVINVDVRDEEVVFDFIFAETDAGKELKSLYDSGYMNAFSVGFIPKDYIWVDNDTPNVVEFTLPSGEKDSLDLTKYSSRPNLIITKWELLEISPVPVPSNPEALLVRGIEVISRKFSGDKNSAAAAILSKTLEGKVHSLEELMDEFLSSAIKMSENPSNVMEFEPGTIDPEITEKNVNQDDLLVDILKECSEDSSGEKEKLDWGKMSRCFAYIDLSLAQNLSSYHYLHHTYSGDNCILVRSALYASMADLMKKCNESNSDAEVEELGKIKAHLDGHFVELAVEVLQLDFKKNYNDEEIKSVFETGTHLKVSVEEEQKTNTEDKLDESSVLVALKTYFKQNEEAREEMEKVLGVKISILRQLVTEQRSLLLEIRDLVNKESHQEDKIAGQSSDDSSIADTVEALKNLLIATPVSIGDEK